MPYKDPEAMRAWRKANREKQKQYRDKHRASGREKERERERKEELEAAMSDHERAFSAVMLHFSTIQRCVAEYEREAWPEIEAARMASRAEKSRLWRKHNRTRARELDRQRERNPIECRAKGSAYRARKRGADGYYTLQDIEALDHAQGGLCAYCDSPWEHVDHKTPLIRGGSNWPDNLQLLCAHHNTSKGAWTDAEYRMRMGWPAHGRVTGVCALPKSSLCQ